MVTEPKINCYAAAETGVRAIEPAEAVRMIREAPESLDAPVDSPLVWIDILAPGEQNRVAARVVRVDHLGIARQMDQRRDSAGCLNRA